MCHAMPTSNVDDESYTLIAALLVRAGCLMEDNSVALVTRVSRDPEKLNAAIRHLSETAANLGALAAAASAILLGGSQSP